jgi:magnesium-transporting ATPase (P-type)
VTPLKDKVRNALDEARMLVLCAQILLGFKFHSAFHPQFEQLALHARWLMVLSLGVLLIAFMLLLLPTTFHRLVEGGEDTGRMHRTTGVLIAAALVPFAASLALDFGVALEKTFGPGAGVAAGIAVAAAALFLWYGLEMLHKRDGAKPMRAQPDEKTPLKDKIQQVLVEARIILPGAQAMLGFQLAAYFTEAFEKLSMTSRIVHTASALCIGLTILLLMTPPAYHRIVNGGEDTPDFDRFAGHFVLGALVPLALGLGSESFVFMMRAFQDTTLAIVASALTTLCLLAVWFLLPIAMRAGRQPRRAAAAAE